MNDNNYVNYNEIINLFDEYIFRYEIQLVYDFFM